MEILEEEEEVAEETLGESIKTRKRISLLNQWLENAALFFVNFVYKLNNYFIHFLFLYLLGIWFYYTYTTNESQELWSKNPRGKHY